MSHRQMLPPPPTVEDAMDDVVLTLCSYPESTFNFEGWQEAPQRVLPQLLPYFLPQATTAPSTDSTPEAVVYSVPLRFKPRCRKGKVPACSQGSTPSNAEFHRLRPQLLQLQQKEEAALPPVQKLQN